MVLAPLILLVAVGGRWSSVATRLSGSLYGLMVIQVLLLGVSGASDSPYLGVLHGIKRARDRLRRLPEARGVRRAEVIAAG